LFKILGQDPNVKDLIDVQEASPPLIRLKVKNIKVDLLFARVNFKDLGKRDIEQAIMD